MSIDRINRDRLAAAMRRFLAGEISAFAFDDERWEIDSNNDPTLDHVSELAWYFYDDCKDHQVDLTKAAWDLWQRLLLLLESDATIQIERRKIWDWSQLVAGFGLMIFLAGAYWLGWGIQLFALAIPFGIVSIWLSRRRERLIPVPSASEQALYPFNSISELLRIRRRYPEFVKERYIRGVEKQPLRSPLEMFALKLQQYSAWLFFSPFVLLAQMFPVSKSRSTVQI